MQSSNRTSALFLVLLLCAVPAGCGGRVSPDIVPTSQNIAQLKSQTTPAAATSTNTATSGPRIYVAYDSGVQTFTASGQRVQPRIYSSAALAVAVGPDRKIYVVNGTSSGSDNTVDAFWPDGSLATPILHVPNALGVAVSSDDKIYVSTYTAILTFDSSGHQMSPTIPGDFFGPIAVGPHGKIYAVGGPNQLATTVFTFTSAGARTTPTIGGSFTDIYGIAVDARSHIYISVAPGTNPPLQVRTYKQDGSRTTPTIRLFSQNSDTAIAVDGSGDILVTDKTFSVVFTYNQQGQRISPTLKAAGGLLDPDAIAVWPRY